MGPAADAQTDQGLTLIKPSYLTASNNKPTSYRLCSRQSRQQTPIGAANKCVFYIRSGHVISWPAQWLPSERYRLPPGCISYADIRPCSGGVLLCSLIILLFSRSLVSIAALLLASILLVLAVSLVARLALPIVVLPVCLLLVSAVAPRSAVLLALRIALCPGELLARGLLLCLLLSTARLDLLLSLGIPGDLWGRDRLGQVLAPAACWALPQCRSRQGWTLSDARKLTRASPGPSGRPHAYTVLQARHRPATALQFCSGETIQNITAGCYRLPTLRSCSFAASSLASS